MEQEEWQTEHFNSRRIAHGRKGKSKGKGGSFDPRRSYGVYQLICPASTKLSRTKARKSTSAANTAEGILEIHGPVEGRDDVLMCTLELHDVLSGVAVLAGSRKALSSAVRDLEQTGVDEEATPQVATDQDKAQSDDDHDGNSSHGEGAAAKSSIELADERERRRYAAFEKNSFRSPKFWMRWRATLSVQKKDEEIDAHEPAAPDSPAQSGGVEVNGGYLVFSGNDCASFDGTVSCDALDWKNVKLSGKKSVSKARECSLGWLDVV